MYTEGQSALPGVTDTNWQRKALNQSLLESKVQVLTTTYINRHIYY